MHSGKYILYVSNEILEEYEEIISLETNALIASNVIQALLNSPYEMCIRDRNTASGEKTFRGNKHLGPMIIEAAWIAIYLSLIHI